MPQTEQKEKYAGWKEAVKLVLTQM